MNKVTNRMCIVCRSLKPKNELIKVVRVNEQYLIDQDNKLFGRSAYICKNHDCIDKSIKQRALNKVFRSNISEDLYSNLKELDFGDKQS